MKKLGIYIHVPFCKQKCNYCDFYSIKWNYKTENKYVEAMLNEIKSYKEKLNGFIADTIFFGGGTPTIVKPDNLKRIIEEINDLIAIDKNAEITIEANPNTLSDENLTAYKEIGINRLSIGIQSLNDEILKKIGRIHNGDEALNSIDRAKKNGFENINADVMFNIHGQTVRDVEDTIEMIIEKDIKHISFYSLKLEKGTPLYIMEQNNKIVMPEEDYEREMYYAGRSVIEKHNLIQYEISNFAVKGYECKHNLKYWNQEEYIGLGPSAHSFLKNIRFSNSSDLNLYCENLQSNKLEKIIHEELSEDDLIFEYIMLRLRLTEGINTDEFNNKFSADFMKMYENQIDYLHKNNLIYVGKNNIKLTEKGMDISNYVITIFNNSY
ncbi:radical SAM family heme chaperone HemW [Sedimentibacter sp.]|uniref:radical SAM family heme chaperone HemW n=1 Tax=Sedimentibacter sp. TaxID=1960295 RepID=UPI0028A76A52|nr:radical SAM family heme chaperone HemW [Sedimentibacter sp.]